MRSAANIKHKSRERAVDPSAKGAGYGELRDNFDYISPLDTRYYGEDRAVYEALHPYLSEAATIKYQILVERAIVATLEQTRIAPPGISQRLAVAASKVTPQQVYEEEHRTHHNIRALVDCLRGHLSDEDGAYVHL